jgi:hypothetical protein
LVPKNPWNINQAKTMSTLKIGNEFMIINPAQVAFQKWPIESHRDEQ